MLNTAKLTSYFFAYLSMSYNIFIFCYIGEIVTEQVIYRKLKYTEIRKFEIFLYFYIFGYNIFRKKE